MTLHLNTSSGAERIDEDTREGEIARRNVLFGLWAGRHAGLEGDALEVCALAAHLADHRSPGHDDVIAKVAADLVCCGKPTSDWRLLFMRDGDPSQPVASLGHHHLIWSRMVRDYLLGGRTPVSDLMAAIAFWQRVCVGPIRHRRYTCRAFQY